MSTYTVQGSGPVVPWSTQTTDTVRSHFFTSRCSATLYWDTSFGGPGGRQPGWPWSQRQCWLLWTITPRPWRAWRRTVRGRGGGAPLLLPRSSAHMTGSPHGPKTHPHWFYYTWSANVVFSWFYLHIFISSRWNKRNFCVAFLHDITSVWLGDKSLFNCCYCFLPWVDRSEFPAL